MGGSVPQGHEISKSAKKKRVASFCYHFPSFLITRQDMVAPRRVTTTNNLEERMEKARLKFERMQWEVQEHQERQKKMEEEEAAQKLEAEKKRQAREEKARKKAREAKEVKEATVGPSTAWTGKSHI